MKTVSATMMELEDCRGQLERAKADLNMAAEELQQAKAENARLAAAIIKRGGDATVYPEEKEFASTTLRELLGPIEDLLETCESLARASKALDLALQCDEQLTRLRAAMEGGK